MNKALVTLLLMLSTLLAKAQSEPEYLAEIGGGVGYVNYLGDFNGSLSSNLQPTVTLLGRYRFNPRSALAFNVSYGKLKGSSEDLDTWYPDYQESTYEFEHNLVDVGMRFEQNFWPFGTGREYYGAKPLTPYVAIGLGMTFTDGEEKTFTANMPIGVGVKYKLAQRWNIGLEWAMHFTLSDKLDGVADPYKVESSGIFKNTDCYSMLRLSITYDFAEKCRTCHNDD